MNLGEDDDQFEEDNEGIYQMNQLNVGSTYNDYMDSLHYRIVSNLDKQVQILNGNTKEPIVVDN